MSACRFCAQSGVHHCPGGELKSGDRYYDLYGDKRAFPGVADAGDHPVWVPTHVCLVCDAPAVTAFEDDEFCATHADLDPRGVAEKEKLP